MASGYIPRNLFHLCDAALLIRQLSTYAAVPGDLPSGMPQPALRYVHALYDALPPDQRARADADLRAVYDLGCETGVHLLLDEGTVEWEDLAEHFATLRGHPDRALWMLVEHPRVFWGTHPGRALAGRTGDGR